MYTKRLSKAGRENGYHLDMLSDNDAYPTRRITVDEGTDFAVLEQVLT